MQVDSSNSKVYAGIVKRGKIYWTTWLIRLLTFSIGFARTIAWRWITSRNPESTICRMAASLDISGRLKVSACAAFVMCALLCLFAAPSRAYAYDSGSDLEYIVIQAENAGMTPSEYVTVIVYGASVSSGYNLANESGVNVNKSLESNLKGIVSSEDYPEYDLSKTSLSEDEYNAARFNSLVTKNTTIGDSDYQAYKSDPVGYTISDYVKTQLENIANVGKAALSFPGAMFGAIKDFFKPKEDFEDWLPQGSNEFDGSTIGDWPSNIPKHPVISLVQSVHSQDASANIMVFGNFSKPVYCFIWRRTTTQINIIACYPEPFNATLSNGNSVAASSYQYQNEIVYYWNSSYNSSSSINDAYIRNMNIPVTTNDADTNTSVSSSQAKIAAWYICHTPISGGGSGGHEQVDQYPSETPGSSTLIIIPGGGMTQSTTWNEMLSQQQIVNDNVQNILNTVDKFGFDTDGCLYTFDKHLYEVAQNFTFVVNSHELKVYDEVISGKLDNILAEIQKPTNNQVNSTVNNFNWVEYQARAREFETDLTDVAPFCAIFLSKMVIDEIALVDPVEDAKFEIPFGFFGNNNKIGIDLNFLDDARPFFNFFTICLLVMSLARGTLHFVNSELV